MPWLGTFGHVSSKFANNGWGLGSVLAAWERARKTVYFLRKSKMDGRLEVFRHTLLGSYSAPSIHVPFKL